jgi:hypothetical protein
MKEDTTMSRRLPATRVPAQPAPRFIYIQQPDPASQLATFNAAEIMARREEYRILRAKWELRQQEIKAKDRKVRRFWLGFGLAVGTAVLLGLGLIAWAMFSVGLAVLAIPAVLLGLVGLGVGGHRCVTIVQHWH